MKFEDAVLEIKRRVDLVQVVGQYVSLKKSNHGFTGLCPFHSEKTPSFHVRPDKGYFKCFGCDAAGDVFTFLEKQTGQLFWDIVQALAGENQIQIDDDSNKQNAEQHRHKKDLLNCLLKAQEYFQAELQNGKINAAVSDYLTQNREFTEEQIKQRKLGFGGLSDDGLIQFLRNNNIQLNNATEVGLINQSETGFYSAFKQRITVPIFNHKGQL
ncbi:MAG: CHC2 zinc finger domain-containing protein, partial [bacterium]|nr:CHC2 zinc finger domain-containing protein [bacterium]